MTVSAAQQRPADPLQGRPVHPPPHKPTGKKPGRARAKSFVTRLRQDSPLLLMTAPAVLVLLLFTYIPLLGSVVAFMDYVPFLGFSQSQWVGWDNFTALFQDDLFWGALTNTFEITFLQLLLFFPVPILLAVLFNSVAMPAVKNFVQSVIYLPHFLSWVIIVALFQQMLGGGGVISSGDAEDWHSKESRQHKRAYHGR